MTAGAWRNQDSSKRRSFKGESRRESREGRVEKVSVIICFSLTLPLQALQLFHLHGINFGQHCAHIR